MAGSGRPDAQRVDRIYGWTIPEAGGINIRDAPHEIGQSELQHGENARWEGTHFRPRGGQGEFEDTNPAGAGFFLWGAYGEVIQHGGIGGAGFLDTPDGEGWDGPDEGDPGFGIFWTTGS